MIMGTLKASAAGIILSKVSDKADALSRPQKLADVGWIWEGQGLIGGVDPSIFGVGEGAEYFGLKKICYMFHPNDALSLIHI